MADTNAIAGLKWVKGEIDASLKLVRESLEAFVGVEGGGGEKFNGALTALDEIRGVLIALQLAGPAILVRAMQQHCEALAKGGASNASAAAEALMLALIQLPDYLDTMGARKPGSPLALLPVMNDLRVSRGEAPLSEAELLVLVTELCDAHGLKPPAEDGEGSVIGTGYGFEGATAAVIAEARRELIPVMDALERYARGPREERNRLAECEPVLRNLGNILAVTGNPELTDKLRSCADAVGALARGDSELSDESLMVVAEEFLSAESALANFGAPERNYRDGADFHRSLVESTLQEVGVEMAGTQRAISRLAQAPGDLRPLQEVLAFLHGMSAALWMLSEAGAADLLDAVRDQIRRRYLAPLRGPAADELELLAQCISAVDLYINSLGDSQPYARGLIGAARQALADLEQLAPTPIEPTAVQLTPEQQAAEQAWASSTNPGRSSRANKRHRRELRGRRQEPPKSG